MQKMDIIAIGLPSRSNTIALPSTQAHNDYVVKDANQTPMQHSNLVALFAEKYRSRYEAEAF